MLSTPRTGSVVPLTYEQVLEKACLLLYANIACPNQTAHVQSDQDTQSLHGQKAN